MTLKDSSIVANRIKTINLLNEVDRPGIPDLIEFLDNTNFFLSPASTKYHNNFYGGLCLPKKIMKNSQKRKMNSQTIKGNFLNLIRA